MVKKRRDLGIFWLLDVMYMLKRKPTNDVTLELFKGDGEVYIGNAKQ